MKKLIIIALAAISTGSVYAAPQQNPQKPDSTKVKKVKLRSSPSNIRINGDTTEIRVVKDTTRKPLR